MTSSPGAWLHNESIFLDRASDPPVRPDRPWNQGDIFADVPLTLTNRAGSGAATPKVRQGYAIMTGHPCSLRGEGNVATIQKLIEVRQIKYREATRFG